MWHKEEVRHLFVCLGLCLLCFCRQPDKLRVVWTRRNRRMCSKVNSHTHTHTQKQTHTHTYTYTLPLVNMLFVVQLHSWQPGIKNPYRGMVVWPVPENIDISVTLFKVQKTKHSMFALTVKTQKQTSTKSTFICVCLVVCLLLGLRKTTQLAGWLHKEETVQLLCRQRSGRRSRIWFSSFLLISHRIIHGSWCIKSGRLREPMSMSVCNFVQIQIKIWISFIKCWSSIK